MPLIAMVSAKGSPGVSTAALACTLAWPAPTLLAECDPAGGDLLAGYLAKYDLPADRGILPLAGSVLRGSAEHDLTGQLIDLDPPKQKRLALQGIADPTQAASLQPSWARLGELFAHSPYLVIADCGRLSTHYAPWPLLHRADLVLLVMRPTSLRTVSPAVAAISTLRRELPGAEGPSGNLGLVLVGGGISAREITRNLNTPVVANIAWDPKTAAALCGDGRGRRNGPLMKSAMGAFGTIDTAIRTLRNITPIAQWDTQPIPVTR
ncbi:hypothetical protein F4553_003002 [Allocatelliglobosispora scoriae]|uniref:ParA family protein n=1 Tax=Allocatelliglobosispora scoriae TaxID=643052 RepID=A0A841BRT7_9ACTN|nr:ParA family protein [Allocatelliglobosispora scoriae]MBB5869623.1 hypothetical protein [Allocatelliglobosispora scoriae]